MPLRLKGGYQDVFLVGFALSLLGPVMMYIAYVAYQRDLHSAIQSSGVVVLGPGGQIEGDVTVTSYPTEKKL